MCLEKVQQHWFKQDLKHQIFASEKQCVVSRHLSNVTLEGDPQIRHRRFPKTSCFSSRPQGQKDKNEKRPMNKASECMSRDSLMLDLPWLHLPCSPHGYHSSCRHTRERGGAQLMYLCCMAASWNRHGGHRIISWFYYAQKYLICINFIAAALSYLHWIDLLWITRIVPQIQSGPCLQNKLQDTMPEVKDSVDCKSNSVDCFNKWRVCPLEVFVHKILVCIFHNLIFRSPALRAFIVQPVMPRNCYNKQSYLNNT